MGRNVYRVQPSDGKWRVKKDGAERADSYWDYKTNAIDRARTLAKNNMPSQVVVHLANGQIETEWTYGDDPYPPPG